LREADISNKITAAIDWYWTEAKTPVDDPNKEQINVVVAMDFSDELMDEIRAVSPRLRVERHFPKVPDKVWETVDILYTGRHLPDPPQAPRLRWIQLHSAGLDHLFGNPILDAHEIEITTTSGIHATPMAEYSLAMMLAFAYKLPLMLQLQAKGQWQNRKSESQGGGALFEPRELRDQMLGIIGYGSIGRELARIADALGMRVLAAKRDLMMLADEEGYTVPGLGDPNGDIPDRIYPSEAVASMARECDFLVNTLPMTANTRGMIGETVFEEMKPTAIFINVGRGGTVDEKALIKALRERKIGGAALDVFEEEPLPANSPLWKLENVILSPHVSGNSTRYHERAARLFVENLHRYLEGEPLLNRVKREREY
jgi:phosphoglycerate dehydrogenase-like enzyme